MESFQSFGEDACGALRWTWKRRNCQVPTDGLTLDLYVILRSILVKCTVERKKFGAECVLTESRWISIDIRTVGHTSAEMCSTKHIAADGFLQVWKEQRSPRYGRNRMKMCRKYSVRGNVERRSKK